MGGRVVIIGERKKRIEGKKEEGKGVWKCCS